jgi:N-acetylneuraminic acid mutarotase
MKRPCLGLMGVLLAAALALSGCGGGGSSVAAGTPSPFLSAASVIPPGDICEFGGIQVDTGVDVNLNGIIDPDEVKDSQYVCHGADGLASLIEVTAEPGGANCADGGYKVESGLDTNANGVLDPGEVLSTSYLCNGAPGSDGADGSDGLATLLTVTPEEAGAQCSEGGYKIVSGYDANANGVLDPEEISSTSYVCNGPTGPAGANALVSVSGESPGENCAAGGFRVDAGLDANRNGVLDPGEVTSTAYACNGASYTTELSANSTSASQIDLAWPDLAGAASVAAYDVYMNWGWITQTAGTTYSATGLAPRTLYCFNVIGMDAAGFVVAWSPEVCTATAYDEPLFGNDDFDTATALGSLPASVTGYINGDRLDVDFYSFTVEADGAIKIILDGMSENLDLYLYDGTEVLVAGSENPSTNPEGIFHSASAGTYYVEVRGDGPVRSAYSLSIETLSPGVWSATSESGAPLGRMYHTAVWTGSKMIVWGGYSGSVVNTGGVYDPVNDTWTPTSTDGAPSARYLHTVVWTGSKMIVWGGYDAGSNYFNDGGIYDPATDTWTPVGTSTAPSGRCAHTAVWTGSKMIVWGGYGYDVGFLNDGGLYDPASDTWTPLSATGAPSSRYLHTAVWTGSKMIVWGGDTGSGHSNDGGLYDPAAGTWAPLSATGAPTARRNHTAVWTGTKMIVWGGLGSGSPRNDGGLYDPAGDTWSATSATDAPDSRINHTAVWTGSGMIVWGGYSGSGFLNTGGKYDPVWDQWTATSTTDAPAARHLHTAVWADAAMVVWGGNGWGGSQTSGGLYVP